MSACGDLNRESAALLGAGWCWSGCLSLGEPHSCPPTATSWDDPYLQLYKFMVYTVTSEKLHMVKAEKQTPLWQNSSHTFQLFTQGWEELHSKRNYLFLLTLKGVWMTYSGVAICSVVPRVKWDESPKFLFSRQGYTHQTPASVSFVHILFPGWKWSVLALFLLWTLLMKHKTSVAMSFFPLSALQMLNRNLHLLVWTQLR